MTKAYVRRRSHQRWCTFYTWTSTLTSWNLPIIKCTKAIAWNNLLFFFFFFLHMWFLVKIVKAVKKALHLTWLLLHASLRPPFWTGRNSQRAPLDVFRGSKMMTIFRELIESSIKLTFKFCVLMWTFLKSYFPIA